MAIFKQKEIKKPVESHDTAAWADKENKKEASKVNIPDEMQIFNAKDYVEDNQK